MVSCANKKEQHVDVRIEIMSLAKDVVHLTRQKKDLEVQVDALREKLKKTDLLEKDQIRLPVETGLITIQKQAAFSESLKENGFQGISPELCDRLIRGKILKRKRLVDENIYESMSHSERDKLLRGGVLKEEIVCKNGGRHFFIGENNRVVVDELYREGLAAPGQNYLRVAV